MPHRFTPWRASRRGLALILALTAVTASRAQLHFEIGYSAMAGTLPQNLPSVFGEDGGFAARRTGMTLGLAYQLRPGTELGMRTRVGSLLATPEYVPDDASLARRYLRLNSPTVQFLPTVSRRLTRGLWLDGGLGYALVRGGRDEYSAFDPETRVLRTPSPNGSELGSYGFAELGLSLRTEVGFLRLGYHQGLTQAYRQDVAFTDVNGTIAGPLDGRWQGLGLDAGIYFRWRERAGTPDESWVDGPLERWSRSRAAERGFTPALEAGLTYFPVLGQWHVAAKLFHQRSPERLRVGVGLAYRGQQVGWNDSTRVLADPTQEFASAPYSKVQFHQLSVPLSADWRVVRNVRLGVELNPTVHLGTVVRDGLVRDGITPAPTAARFRLDGALVGSILTHQRMELFGSVGTNLTPITDDPDDARFADLGYTQAFGRVNVAVGMRFKLMEHPAHPIDLEKARGRMNRAERRALRERGG